VAVDGESLALSDVLRVAREGVRVVLAPEARARMAAGRAVLERALAGGADVYGATTGVGSRKQVRVHPSSAGAFNRLLVRAHRVGQGAAAPEDVVRATLLRLANGFARGTTGVRPELAERLLAVLNDGPLPRIRMLGSIGQGDLAPLADVAHDVFGDLVLAPSEGLALVGSNSFSTALAALAVADAERLLDALDTAGALALEGFSGNVSPLAPAVGESRPYPGLQATAARLRKLLDGSFLWEEGAARNLQDPLSFRCLPQVHGAARDALAFAQGQLAIELNASQQNPLVDLVEERVVSVGNFDVLPLAAALDFLRVALAPALTAVAERAIKLLQASLSGLTNGLAARANLAEDGLTELAVVAQALAGEARLLAQPVSVEPASSIHNEGIEDRMTLAPLAARRVSELVGLGERLVAVELVVAAQAVDLRGRFPLGAGTGAAYRLVRGLVDFTDAGEALPQDLEPVVELVQAGRLR
jgi:histidine ammonia-lyase